MSKAAKILLLFATVIASFQSTYGAYTGIDSLELQLSKLPDNETKLQTFIEILAWYEDNRPSAEAISRCIEAADLARTLGDDFALAKILRLRGEINLEVNQSDYETSIQFFEDAKEILSQEPFFSSDNIEVAREKAIILKNLGYIYWLWGKLFESHIAYDTAIFFTKEVLSIYPSDSVLRKTLGQQYNSKGTVLWAQGDYENALDYYLQSQDLFKGLELFKNLSLINSNIGLIFSAWNQKDDALYYYEKALSYGLTSGDAFAIAYAMNNLGKFHESFKNYDSALYYYEQSSKKYLEANRMGGVGLNLNGIGKIYADIGRIDESLDAFFDALEIATNNSAYYWVALAKSNLANTYKTSGDYTNALRFANESLELARKERYIEIIQENYRIVSEIYSSKRDFEKAMTYLGKYYEVRDTLFSQEKYAQIAQIKTQFDIEKRNQDLELLRKDKLIQEQNLKRANLEKWSLVILLVILVVLFAVFIYTQRRTRIFNKKLQKQSKQLLNQKQNLEWQAAELKKNNNIKNLLFSIVSHDLRNPLAGLENMINLINKDYMTAEEFRESLPVVATSISQINHLTENLLYWARGQMDGVKPNPIDFDLKEITEGKLPWFEKFAENKGIHIYKDMEEPIAVYADPYMVELIIRNLVSNAIKFSKKGNTIWIKAETEDGMAKVSVSDSGIGIPPEYLTDLFGENMRSTLGTKNEQGHGIGLKICHQFVNYNGGQIWVESIYRKGSTFYFTLPLSVKKPKRAALPV